MPTEAGFNTGRDRHSIARWHTGLHIPWGLFVWLRLPGRLSSENLIKFAVEEGVSFSPGTFFFVDACSGEGCMRLNFSVQTPEMIRLRKAIERLVPGVG